VIDFQALLSVLPPVLTVAFAIGGVLAYRQSRDTSRRLRRSVRAQGVVTEVDYNSSLQVFPTVRFAAADGSTVLAKPQSSSNVARFQVGQPVGLRYDPADPGWIAVDGLPAMAGAGRLVGAALLVAAVVLAAVTVVTR
jgi:hypothetical protein